MRAKAFAKEWLSPGAIRVARRLLAYVFPPQWERVPEGWKTRAAQGWNSESIVEVQTAKWAEFERLTRGKGPLGVAHEARFPELRDYATHNTLMSFAYVLALTARGKERVSVLDWGGGLGHYYLLSRAFVPSLELDYHCKDLPLICQRGRELLPEVHFHESAESCLGRGYDLVLASSSLQYSENWRETVRQLVGMTGSYLFVTRMPIIHVAPSFVVLQRPYSVGYRSEYLGWFLNRREFLETVEAMGVERVREFLIDERPQVHRAPEQVEYRGFLWRAVPPDGRAPA